MITSAAVLRFTEATDFSGCAHTGRCRMQTSHRTISAGLLVVGVAIACSKNYPPVASLVLSGCEGRTYELALRHVEDRFISSGMTRTENASGKDHPSPAVVLRTYSIGEPQPDLHSNNVVAAVTVTARSASIDIMAATGVSDATYRLIGEALVQGEALAHSSCSTELDIEALH